MEEIFSRRGARREKNRRIREVGAVLRCRFHAGYLIPHLESILHYGTMIGSVANNFKLNKINGVFVA
jgi:hypothetical protein